MFVHLVPTPRRTDCEADGRPPVPKTWWPYRYGVAIVLCDVYDVYMVRKQLYISDEHERALKARAKELGVSEAELVRRMLDGLLLDEEGGGRLARAGAAEALEGFLEEAERLAQSHRFPEGYVFYRDELYEDRA